MALEGLLTGLALGLGLHYLSQEGAQAAPLTPPSPGSASTSTAAGHAEGADAAGAGHSRRSGRLSGTPRSQAGSAAAGSAADPLTPASGPTALAIGRLAAGSDGSDLLAGRTGAAGLGAAAADPIASEGLIAPPAPASQDSPPAWLPEAGRGEDRPGGTAEEGGEPGSPRLRTLADGEAAPPPASPPPPPRLLIGVSSRISLVGRSVTDTADAVIRQDQVALADSLIDLSQSPIQLLEIRSERDLRGVAESRTAGASLLQEGSHSAVQGSTLLASLQDSTTRISAIESLRLGVRGESGASLAVDDRVSALEASALEDGGGANDVTLLASLDLLLSAPPDAAAMVPLQLRSTALRDSTLRLGPGPDQVWIGALLRLEAPDAAATSSLSGAAVGLRDSLLDAGGGDDRVEILALATTTGAKLEAIALEGSTVRLGPGDDSLLLQGDVRRSRLEPGPGFDRLLVQGGSLSDSVLVLDPGGQALLELGDGADGLRIEAAGALRLSAGGGDDRITLSGAIRGSVDGGPGEDLLELEDWDGLLGSGTESAALAGSPGADPFKADAVISLLGGPGEDLFVLPDLGSLLGRLHTPRLPGKTAVSEAPAPSGSAASSMSPQPRLSLPDLTWWDRGGDSYRFSDRLALRRSGPAAMPGSRDEQEQGLIPLRPSGLEGIGDGRLLPIAPLEQLLSGISDATPQLAIATAADGAELVLLGAGSGPMPLAELPALRSRSMVTGGMGFAAAAALQPVAQGRDPLLG